MAESEQQTRSILGFSADIADWLNSSTGVAMMWLFLTLLGVLAAVWVLRTRAALKARVAAIPGGLSRLNPEGSSNSIGRAGVLDIYSIGRAGSSETKSLFPSKAIAKVNCLERNEYAITRVRSWAHWLLKRLIVNSATHLLISIRGTQLGAPRSFRLTLLS